MKQRPERHPYLTGVSTGLLLGSSAFLIKTLIPNWRSVIHSPFVLFLSFVYVATAVLISWDLIVAHCKSYGKEEDNE